MTPEEHKERHQMLHKYLDELLADFIRHNPGVVSYLRMPVLDLMAWSNKQTENPTE
jgi:hypothetical protein